MSMHVPLIVLAAAAVLAACQSDAAVPSGDWGGDHLIVTVEDSGARIEFDCAHGVVDRPIEVDDKGHFDVTGQYVREHGGPVRLDETEDTTPARYSGEIEGRTMRLTVAMEGSDPLGPFTVVLGQRARLVKCK